MIPEADEVKGTFYAWVYARISIESPSECLCAPFCLFSEEGYPKERLPEHRQKKPGTP